MKRILTAIVFCLLALSAVAQTQRVVVKTPGRQQDDGSITKGQRIAEAYVTVQGGNTYESDTNGELRMGKPSTGKYRFSGVRKEGYELADADFLMRSYIYSDVEPLYITLVKPSEQLEVQLHAEQKVRRTLKQQLERVESEIERQYEAQKITEEEYYQRLQQVYDDIERNDKLIGYMSERYAGLDFDCLDEFNRELNRLIINGELAKADSLLITAGDIESEYAALLRHRAINQELHHDIEQSEEFTRKRIEDIASRCYSKHQIHSLRYERDSAAYYLELRAELDPENMEWQVELAEYLIEYIADYDTALTIYDKAVAKSIEINGEKHTETADILGLMGLCCQYSKEYDKAAECYNRALDINVELFGEEHERTAITYKYLGEYYTGLNDFSKAEEYFNKALYIQQKVLGKNHSDNATLYNSLGSNHNFLGDYNAAIKYYKKALAIQAKIDLNHANTAMSYEGIGSCYEALEEFDKALEYYNKALDINIEVVGFNHQHTAMTYSLIGRCYECLNSYKTALSYYSKALGINVTIYGEEHPHTSIVYSCIGRCYENMYEYDTALLHYHKALDITIKCNGKMSLETATTYMMIGTFYFKLEQVDCALEYLLLAESAYVGSNDPETPSMMPLRLYEGIGMCYGVLGDIKRTYEYLEKALNIAETTLTENDPTYQNLQLLVEKLRPYVYFN